MKPIIKREEQDTILTSEITNEHIVVASIENKPAILSVIENKEDVRMLSVRGITRGDHFGLQSEKIKDKIEKYIDISGCNVEVFHSKDWKKALQWLIDNCE